MNNFSINKINKFSQFLHDYISEYKMTNSRVKKSTVLDGILFKLLYSQLNNSQPKTASNINHLKLVHKFGLQLSRQSYISRENSIPLKFYEDLFTDISKYADINIYKKNFSSQEIFLVDGVKNNLLKTKDLIDNGYNTNINDASITALSIGIYNITRQTPLNIQLVKHKNERQAFIDVIKNSEKLENNIFVFDRGFPDGKLFSFMNENNSYFVCRIKDNMNIVPKTDEHITIYNGVKVKVYKYMIKDSEYIIATNLLESNMEMIKNTYNNRWNIEEFFKYIKSNFNFSYMNEKSEESIKKTIFAQLIITKIADIIIFLYKKYNTIDPKYVINRQVLLERLFNNLLFQMITRKGFNKHTIKDLLKESIVLTHTNKGKSVKITCNRPYKKWYIKKYINKYIKIKEDHDTFKIIEEKEDKNIKKLKKLEEKNAKKLKKIEEKNTKKLKKLEEKNAKKLKKQEKNPNKNLKLRQKIFVHVDDK